MGGHRGHGNRLTHVADGVVHAPIDLPLAERLVALFRQLIEVLDEFRPDEAAVEETFVNKNAASTLRLGVARGVVLLAPAERGLPVAEYSANLVKKSVVGAGHAEKAQVQMMVRRLLPGCAIAEGRCGRRAGGRDLPRPPRRARARAWSSGAVIAKLAGIVDQSAPTARSSMSAGSAISRSARPARSARCRLRAPRRGC